MLFLEAGSREFFFGLVLPATTIKLVFAGRRWERRYTLHVHVKDQ